MARLVPIKSFLSLPEALVACGYLQEQGIFAALNVYYHGCVAWHHIFALGGIELSVLDIERDQARQLIGEVESGRGEPTKNVPERPARRATVFQIAVALVVLGLAGLPLPLWSRRGPNRDQI